MAKFEGFGADFAKDYDDAKAIAYGDKPGALPAGTYILEIKNAKMRDTQNGKRYLALLFDIAEGECEGYYHALFEYEKKFDSAEEDKKAKWKGIFKIWMPDKADGEEKYKSAMSRLKAAITAINTSNQTKPPITPANGWGEEDFKGKLVGGAFGEKEWEYLGRTGWKTECRWLADIEKVREGKVNTPEKLPLKSKPETKKEDNEDLSGYSDIISENDLPF
jgi:hypothetical protein